MKIFLIGLPGSGKSTLGKQLADALHLPFIDLDDEIERECRKPIAEIFKLVGEAWFREKEARVLHDRSKENQTFVMATGGGTPCFHEGIDLMNTLGLTIFLDVPVADIAQRMNAASAALRPLLSSKQNSDQESRLHELYEKRIPFYSRSRVTVRGSNINVEALVKVIPPESPKN